MSQYDNGKLNETQEILDDITDKPNTKDKTDIVSHSDSGNEIILPCDSETIEPKSCLEAHKPKTCKSLDESDISMKYLSGGINLSDESMENAESELLQLLEEIIVQVCKRSEDKSNATVTYEMEEGKKSLKQDKGAEQINSLGSFGTNDKQENKEDEQKEELRDPNSPAEQAEDSEDRKKMKRKIFLIFVVIHIVAFLASFSYWIQSGVLPYLTRKLGVNPEMFGYMESSFAVYQLIGSPIFGRAGDVFGCRVVMVISEVASAVSYGSLAFAGSILFLFLSRIPAIFMHNLQGSYMIITDITIPSNRANMLGKLGVSHGVGMVAGSFVGGVITEAFSEETATLVAACGNLLCALFITIFIPNDTKSIRRRLESMEEPDPPTEQPIKLSFGLKEILSVLKIDIMKYLLFIKVSAAFPLSLLYSMFTMAIMDYFKLGPRENGIILAYIGLLGMFIQGVLIGMLTKRFSDPALVKYAMFMKAGAFLFLIIAENIFFFCFLLLPLGIGATVAHLVLISAITKVVPIADTGSALGLTMSCHAVVRSVAPTLGGLIFTNIGWPFFGVVGYGISLFLSGYIVLLGREDY